MGAGKPRPCIAHGSWGGSQHLRPFRDTHQGHVTQEAHQAADQLGSCAGAVCSHRWSPLSLRQPCRRCVDIKLLKTVWIPSAVLCCAMLCYAVLCCAVLCYAVLCCAVLCYAVLCCAVPCHAVCCAMPCHVVSCCGLDAPQHTFMFYSGAQQLHCVRSNTSALLSSVPSLCNNVDGIALQWGMTGGFLSVLCCCDSDRPACCSGTSYGDVFLSLNRLLQKDRNCPARM